MIKVHLVFFWLLLTTSLAVGQVGVRFNYSNTQQGEWVEGDAVNQDAPDFTNFRLGIDFRKRLKSPRIEFYPTLWIGVSNKLIFGVVVEPTMPDVTTPYSIQYFNVSLALNTHIYILDLEGDCDCPTWGKEGGLFKKGFFVHLAPELGARSVQGSNTTVSEQTTKLSLLYGISGGVGLDIGITEKMTLTPMFRIGYYGPTSLPEYVETISGKGDDKTIYYGPEIRLGIEF